MTQKKNRKRKYKQDTKIPSIQEVLPEESPFKTIAYRLIPIPPILTMLLVISHITHPSSIVEAEEIDQNLITSSIYEPGDKLNHILNEIEKNAEPKSKRDDDKKVAKKKDDKPNHTAKKDVIEETPTSNVEEEPIIESYEPEVFDDTTYSEEEVTYEWVEVEYDYDEVNNEESYVDNNDTPVNNGNNSQPQKPQQKPQQNQKYPSYSDQDLINLDVLEFRDFKCELSYISHNGDEAYTVPPYVVGRWQPDERVIMADYKSPLSPMVVSSYKGETFKVQGKTYRVYEKKSDYLENLNNSPYHIYVDNPNFDIAIQTCERPDAVNPWVTILFAIAI